VALRGDGLGHRGAAHDGHAVIGHGVGQRAVRPLGPEIGDARDLDAGLDQIQRRAVTVAVGGGNDGPVAGAHRVVPHQPLRRRGVHHARQVVVAEHHGLLVRAGGDHHAARAQLVHAVAPDDRQVVVGEPAVARGVRQHGDVGVGGDAADQALADPCRLLARRIEPGVAERTAERRVLLDQHHLGAGVRRVQRRRQARGTTADDGDVGEQVLLVVVAVMGLQVDLAQAGQRADQLFPVLPRALRAEEGLVVEADRQEAAQPVDGARVVARQAAEHVLRLDVETRGDAPAIGQHARLAADLDQAVGVVAGGREESARAVVLERARQHRDTIGGQRAGDRVAFETRIGLAVEAEGDRLRTVQQRAGGRRQAAHGHGVSLGVSLATGAS
jgi:hypothetical protein